MQVQKQRTREKNLALRLTISLIFQIVEKIYATLVTTQELKEVNGSIK